MTDEEIREQLLKVERILLRLKLHEGASSLDIATYREVSASHEIVRDVRGSLRSRLADRRLDLDADMTPVQFEHINW